MRVPWWTLGLGLAAFLMSGCGSRVARPPTPSPQPAPVRQAAVGFLHPGQEWRSLANNLVVPHEVIQIAAAKPQRIVANLFITESGSLLEGRVREVGPSSPHAVHLAGTLGEPGLFQSTTVPVTMTIRYVNPTTIRVTQSVKGSLLNSFSNQAFHLASGG